jgi:hypothetical protein
MNAYGALDGTCCTAKRGDRLAGKLPGRGAQGWASTGSATGTDFILSPESPIGGSRPNIPHAAKEGHEMISLYTVLMGIAGLALVFAVGGLAILWRSPVRAATRHPSQREG